MSHIERLSPELRADLVAYLDGELDDTEALRIEEALATNPVVRHEVEMLTRTWEMLESLPLENASPDFTARTLETIVLTEHGRSFWQSRAGHLLKQGGYYLAWFVGLSIAGLLGFLTTYRWIPNEGNAVLDDLPVIQRLDVYSEVRSADYLRRLRQSGALSNRMEAPSDEP